MKVVVYASSFYEELLAMVLGYNDGILEEDIDIDSNPVTIGWCICKAQTLTYTRASRRRVRRSPAAALA